MTAPIDPADDLGQPVDGEVDVIARGRLLDKHRRRTQHGRGEHGGIVGKVLRLDERRHAVLEHRVAGEQLPEVRIAAAPGAEESRACGEIVDILDAQLSRPVPVNSAHCSRSPAAFTRTRTAFPGM